MRRAILGEKLLRPTRRKPVAIGQQIASKTSVQDNVLERRVVLGRTNA
jgi:hypothetical protein